LPSLNSMAKRRKSALKFRSARYSCIARRR
jgi:hypothetical protein